MPERLSLSDEESPGLAFDVYDVMLPRSHRMWLELNHNSATTPVWLGHHLDADGAAVMVGTVPRAEVAADMDPLAWDAPGMPLGRFLDLFQVPVDPAQLSAVLTGIRAHLEEQLVTRGTWPRVTWTVAGTAAPAQTLHFAGAWLSITELPAAFLIAIGTGITPDALTFEITTGEPYGVDLAAPITTGQMRSLPTATMPRPRRPHPDLHRFLSGPH